MRELFTAGVIDAMLDLARYRAIYQEFRLIGTEFATVEQTKNLTVMKRICLSLFALLLVIGIQAAPVKPVTVLLMDSANSLINGASILANGTLLSTTSWDGRALICVVDRLPIQVVAPHRDTLRTTIIPDQAGQTVILRMSDKRYAPEVVVGSYGKTSRRYGIAEKMAVEVEGVAAASPDVMYMTSAATTSKTSSAAVRVRGVSSVKNKATAAAAPAPIVDEEEAVEEVVALGYGAVSKGSYASPANLPSAGKLTAGEVNDFAKWALWTNVLDQSHKQYIADWKMQPRVRFTAQVTNTEGYPLCDIPVNLVDDKGNTIFQARTDNTGKAELWNGLQSEASERPLFITVEDRCIEAKPFSEAGILPIRLSGPCASPEVADVFFIFDATGSMGDELRYLQAEMQDVIRRSQSAVDGLKIRTGALVYRDHTDEYVTRISRLTDDISATQKFISEQHAMGGGDYEEAIPEALMASFNAAGWSEEARARIAFLVLDAPCHQDSVTLRLLHEQVFNAAAQGIRLVPVVCSGLRESGELLMRSLALFTNGTSFFLTDDSGIGNSHLKPTTDSLRVEHLNDMLVRTIISFTSMPDCNVEQWSEEAIEEQETDRFIPDPFRVEDLDTVPERLPDMPLSEVLNVRPNPCTDFCLVDLPLGCDALFLADMTGKTLAALGPQAEGTSGLHIDTSSFASGIYFVKAFYGGRWYSRKLIVRS